MVLQDIIGGFVVILIGTNLIGPVANSVVAAQTGNVTGAASSILGLTTTFFSLAIMSTGVAMSVSGLRNAGLV